MFPGNMHVIRPATDADADALRRLAQLDSQSPLAGDVLVAERDGEIVAAISREHGRAIADPFRPTSVAVVQLRLRADALRAVQRTPSLARRIRAAVRIAPHPSASGA